jgi:glycolate oxidase
MTLTSARPDLRAMLSAIVGEANVLTGEGVQLYSNDVYRSLTPPIAVVRPGTVEELQAVVSATALRSTPLAIRGGGASYTDGYLPQGEGHVLLDLGSLDRIVLIEANGGYVTVEAGVTWATLRDTLAVLDLRTPFWGPFSGLAATIGGSMSQNSISHGSGAYGISADSALSFDIVTADGSLLSTGSAAAGLAPFSRHFGPDLTGLFTGDCGMLGIKARIRLPRFRRDARSDAPGRVRTDRRFAFRPRCCTVTGPDCKAGTRRDLAGRRMVDTEDFAVTSCRVSPACPCRSFGAAGNRCLGVYGPLHRRGL